MIPPSPSKVILKEGSIGCQGGVQKSRQRHQRVHLQAQQILQHPSSNLAKTRCYDLHYTSKQQPHAIGTRNLFSLLQTDASSSNSSSEEEESEEPGNKAALNSNSTTNSNNTNSTQNTQPTPNHKKTPSISPVIAPTTTTPQQQNAKSQGKKSDADMAAEIKRLESALSANMAEVGQLESQLKQLLLSQQNKK